MKVALLVGALYLVSGQIVVAQKVQQRPLLLKYLQDELTRNYAILSTKPDPKVYYLAYSVNDQELYRLQATMGSLQTNQLTRTRILDIILRVGSPKLDNYRELRGELPRFTPGAVFPLEDVELPVRQELWLHTHQTYQRAARRYLQILTDQEIRVQADRMLDFSEAPVVHYYEELPDVELDVSKWITVVKKISALFRPHSRIANSGVGLDVSRKQTYFVSSESTELAHGQQFVRLVISAQAQAPDGMEIELMRSFEGDTTADLPSEDEITQETQRLIQTTEALLNAPDAEPYVGPAILSGKAAGVFFHEIFGHRVEGHRLRNPDEGQTFKEMVGQQILPAYISVIFDPTLSHYQGIKLLGFYKFDDEGVPAQRVVVVEDGVLKGFLMSRAPAPGFTRSNGHGRRQPGLEPVARQSNLIVEAKQAVPFARLREMLVEEIRRQGKPYGLYFEEVRSGYTLTARRSVQAFKVVPLVVYRVYPDGRPDELVRGVDIVGTPLSSLAKILAVSDRPEVFNGYCYAESGAVPVSAVSPAILIGEIEISRKPTTNRRPPLLPPPPLVNN